MNFRILKYIVFGVASLSIPALFIVLYIELESLKKESKKEPTSDSPIVTNTLDDARLNELTEMVEDLQKTLTSLVQKPSVQITPPSITVEPPEITFPPLQSVARVPRITFSLLKAYEKQLKYIQQEKVKLCSFRKKVDPKKIGESVSSASAPIDSLTSAATDNPIIDLSEPTITQHCNELGVILKEFELLEQSLIYIERQSDANKEILLETDFSRLEAEILAILEQAKFHFQLLNNLQKR